MPAIGDDMPIRVLLVDDSPGDVRLTREVFKDANREIELHVASDGMEAMDFLRRQGAYGDAPRPDLVLLDLNMPRMDGREVLAQIKGDYFLKSDPGSVLDGINTRLLSVAEEGPFVGPQPHFRSWLLDERAWLENQMFFFLGQGTAEVALRPVQRLALLVAEH